MKILIILVLSAITVIVIGKIKEKTKKIHIKFILDIVRALIVITALTFIAQNLSGGTNIWALVIKNSALIVAVLTFVAQKTLGNIIAGISLSIAKPFDIGDKVKVVDGSSVIAEGIVKSITLRHSIIQTFDEQTILVPNSVLDNASIINTTYTTDVGRFLEVQIGYDDDIEKATEIIKKVCDREPLVIKATEPLLSAYEASGVTLKNTVFTASVNDNFIACSNIRKKLLKAFKNNGITIPYQTLAIKEERIVTEESKG